MVSLTLLGLECCVTLTAAQNAAAEVDGFAQQVLGTVLADRTPQLWPG